LVAPCSTVSALTSDAYSQMKLAGMLQGAGISLTIGKPSEGDSTDDIIVRIKADAPVLRPDKPVL
jgi:hypothetical protein